MHSRIAQGTLNLVEHGMSHQNPTPETHPTSRRSPQDVQPVTARSSAQTEHTPQAPASQNRCAAYLASTHACVRLRNRAPHLQHADMHRLRRVLVALCHQGRRLAIEPWVMGQYYLRTRETHSQRELILAMQSLPEQPGASLIRTVLDMDEFAMWNRKATSEIKCQAVRY